MVDFIITDFESVRGGGNIVDTVPSPEDFIVDNCTISSVVSGEFVLTPGASDVGSVSLTVSSASVTVGGTVTLTATVLDDEDEPLEDISVSFRAGSSVIGSDTTDSSGEASYTATMSSVGTFSMTAVAGGVTSTAQSVTVNKITSTISLSAVSSTISVGDSPQLTGTLSVGSGESVKIYLGDVLVDTVTTGTNGAFSFTGSATSTSGNLTFKAVYDGDSTHSSVTSSNVVITVSGGTPVVTTVSLTSDKSILSAYDSEYATLTATVLDSSSNPMSGETVSFDIVDSGSVVENIGTATTNSSGVATVSYYAEGAGDLNIQASVGMIVSETYRIEDCSYYSTTEYKQNSEGITLNIPLPSTFKLEFDLKPTSRSTSGWGSSCYMRIGESSASGVWAGQLTSAGKHGLIPKPSGSSQYCTSYTVLNTDNHVTLTFNGTSITYACNNETVSLSASNLTKIDSVVPTANVGLKNIKVKPL